MRRALHALAWTKPHGIRRYLMPDNTSALFLQLSLTRP